MERSKQQVAGPVSAVPCPWCGRPNDLRNIEGMGLLEKGARVDCDHCKRVSVVDGIDTRPRVIVRQYHGR